MTPISPTPDALSQFQIQQEVNLLNQVRALQIALLLAKDALTTKAKIFIIDQLISTTRELMPREEGINEEGGSEKVSSTN
jgi:hypothetical protein